LLDRSASSNDRATPPSGPGEQAGDGAFHDDFMRLFLRHQTALYRYISVLVPSRSDASDVLQETALALWNKYDTYDPAQPFMPWAKKFAYFEALKFCRANSHYSVMLAGDLIESLAREFDRAEPLLESRSAALQHCLSKLSKKERELVRLRYASERSLVEFAEKSGESVHMMRKNLVSIRRRLLRCIDRQLSAE